MAALINEKKNETITAKSIKKRTVNIEGGRFNKREKKRRTTDEKVYMR